VEKIHLNLFETDNNKIISIKIYDILNQDIYAYGYSIFDFIKKKKIILKHHIYHDFFKFNHEKDMNESLLIDRDTMQKVISYDVYDIFDMSKKEFCSKFHIIEWIL
jgi:hypothetical protein